MTAKPPLQVLDLVNSYGLNYSPCYLCFLPFSTLLLGENLLSHKNVIFKKVIFDSFIDGAFWHFFVESILGQRFEVSDPPCNSFQGVTAMKNKENLGLNAWLLQNMYLNMSAWKLGWMVQFKGKKCSQTTLEIHSFTEAFPQCLPTIPVGFNLLLRSLKKQLL